jgi:hypothetical protein
MPKPLVVSIPHSLGQQEALRRVKEGIAYLKTKQAHRVAVLQDNWTDNQVEFIVKAVGQSAAGTIDVAEDQVTCSVQLPGVLGMLADKARWLIEKEGTLLLEKK